jgi:hypothetical protein
MFKYYLTDIGPDGKYNSLYRYEITQHNEKQWDLPLHLKYRDYESRIQSFKEWPSGLP